MNLFPPHAAVRPLCILLHAALLLTSATAEEVSHRDEAKWKLAARAAAREVLDRLPELSNLDAAETAVLVEELKRMMLTAVHQHESVNDSREAARVRVKEHRVAKAGELMDRAAARANEMSPLPIARADIIAPLGNEWQTRRDDAVNRFVEAHFDAIYAAARSAAVLIQKEEIEKSIRYPRFEDLDARLAEQAPDPEKARTALSREAFERLRPWVQSVAIPGGFSFEENRPVIAQLGERIVLEIHKQYDRQMSTVREIVKAKTVPDERIVRGAIEEFLAAALKDSVGVSKPDEFPLYSPFTAVRNHAAWQAQELERERLLAFLAQPDTISIERSDVEKRLEAELAQHREPGKSRQRLLDAYVESLRRPLAERYAARSKTPVANQVDVLLLSNDKIAAAFLDRIGSLLEDVLPPAREAVAARQFEQVYPALREKKPLTEKMIVFLHDAQASTVKDLDLLREFLEQEPDLAARPHNSADILVETQQRALEAANAAAVPLVKALGSQLRLLADMEKNRLEEIRRDVMDGKSAAEITEAWTADLEQSWKRHADSGPAPALFARTGQQLDKTVRQLYNAIKAEWTRPQPVAIEQASPDTVEVPEEKPEEEKDEDLAGLEEELLACEGLADFVLILADMPGGNGRALFGTPANRKMATAEFSPVDMEAAAETIAQAIRDPFMDLVREKTRVAQSPALLFWRKKVPRAIVLVLEHSGETRHITSILLQRRIREQLHDWKRTRKTEFDMIWQESLGLEP